MKKKTEELAMPKDHISFTQMDLYATCPAWYKTKYWDKVRGVRTVMLDFGSLIHQCANDTNQLIMSLKKKDDLGVEEVKAIYDKHWKEYDLDFNYYQKGWGMVLDHAERTFVTRAEVFKSEYELACKLEHQGQSITLVGIIDRVDITDGTLTIKDYKTGALLPSHDEVDANFQMNIYTFLMHKQFPEYQRVRTSFYALALGKEVIVDKDLDKLDGLEDYLIELWLKMGSDKEFKPRLNGRCFWCPKKCDLYTRLLKEQLSDARIAEDIPELVRQYKTAKGNLKVLKSQVDMTGDLLKKHIAEAGTELTVDGETLLLINKDRAGYTCEVKPTSWQEIKFAKDFKEKKVLDKKARKV